MAPRLHTPEASTTGGPRWNALKHGRYAQPGPLPGEDATQFAHERRALFHNYRPQTKDEADLVAAMARYRWTLARYDTLQDLLDAQALALECDAAGRVTEPLAHQRLHSGMDVTVQCQRLSRLWHKARTELRLVQQQRRHGLVPGAVKLPEGCYLDVDGIVYGPVIVQPIQPVPEPDIAAEGVAADRVTDDGAATASTDGAFEKNTEQQETRAAQTDEGTSGSQPRPTGLLHVCPGSTEGFPGYGIGADFQVVVPEYPCLSL